jgi:hypothetical protein
MNKVTLTTEMTILLYNTYHTSSTFDARGVSPYYQSMGWNLIYDCAIPGYTLPENQLVFFLLAIS